MKTIASAYIELTEILNDACIENAAFESRIIIEKICNLTYTEFLLRKKDLLSDEEEKRLTEFVNQRLKGIPLQYLIGEWDFMGRTFSVGEGVLIPRPETEELCETVITTANNKSDMVIYDLCAGSGCIGITMQNTFPKSDVILVEKSALAIDYIKKNIERLCINNKPTLYHESIFDTEKFDSLPSADIIISNPPYIKTIEIESLQQEVQKEPFMALDGGEDGLDFYRIIANFWTSKLKTDGFIALECGEDQAEDICDLFSKVNFSCTVIKDFNNIERIIIARRNVCDS